MFFSLRWSFGDYTRVPRPRISRQFASVSRRQEYQRSKSLMNFLMGSMCLLICQGQKLWQSSPRKHRKNIHWTSIIPEINYKRFREGAALHLFVIISSVEIKVNGLISDWCRSSFSSIKWYLPNSICGPFKEHREPESINNLQFTLAKFACSNSLATSRQNAGSSWESWLQNPMRFYQSLWGFKKVCKLFQQRKYDQ